MSKSPPNATFTQFCSALPPQGPQRAAFETFAFLAFKSDPAEYSNYATIRSHHTCAEIWRRFAVYGDVVSAGEQRAGFGYEPIDMRQFASLAGLPNLGLTVWLGKTLPANLEFLETLNLHGLKIFLKSDEMPAAQRAKLVAQLGKLTQLRRLTLADVGVEDLSPLAPLVNLEDFTSSRTRPGLRLKSIAFLAGWTELKKVDISHNDVTDISPLKNALQLEYLLLHDGKVASIEPLMNLANLEFLQIDDNPPIPSILALQFLPNLRFLTLSNAGITDVGALGNLQLELLDLSGNPLASIDGIAGSPVEELRLHKTEVQDLTAIASMPNLTAVSLSGVASVKKFPELPPEHPLAAFYLSGMQVPRTFCKVFGRPQTRWVAASGITWSRGDLLPAWCH